MIRNAQATELRWILEHIGCEEVDVEFLDYNTLQFGELSGRAGRMPRHHRGGSQSSRTRSLPPSSRPHRTARALHLPLLHKLLRRKPRFSIVLATKNGMPFVREAAASLKAQTLDDYEVVVQDAASTDGTAEFLRQLRLPNVRIASEPDSGLGDAYNRAFPRCRGEIVGILDSDNLLVPKALEAVDALFRRHQKAVAIYGAVTMIDATGQQVGSFVPAAFDQRALMRCELVPPFSSSFFHRHRCGPELRSDTSLAACQDFELWLRLSDRKIVRSTTVLGATRLSHKSMSRNAENYEDFCAQKIGALERFIADRPRLQRERDGAIAGIYCWAAESILDIEGPGPRFKSFVDRAAALCPEDERLERVRDQAAKLGASG
jgi:Glycosyl transferase family 2